MEYQSEITESNQQRRVIWLLVIFTISGIYVYLHLAVWQLFARAEHLPGYKPQGAVIPATRGTIMDAGGHPLVLAGTLYEVGVTPQLLDGYQIRRLVPDLSVILNVPERELYRVITYTNTIPYVVLGRDLPPRVRHDLDALEHAIMSEDDPDRRFTLDAFRVTARPVRIYPEGGLAAALLGIINSEGVKTGLENRYDEALGGVDGQRSTAAGQLFNAEAGFRPEVDGADLTLSIDRNLQAQAELLLSGVISESRAIRGTLVIMDATTGAVLTMANSPTYDPNDWQSWRELEPWVFNNMAVSSLYEPRATFMPLTIAAALESNVITTGTTYDDHGALVVGGQRFVNWDLDKRPKIARTTLTETLVTSRIYGSVYIGTLMGPARFYEMVRRFGFGEPTGIDLPSEQAGEMPLPGTPEWNLAFLGFSAIGRSLTVTPIQLAAAYTVLANQGQLMRPYIVQEQRGERLNRTEPYVIRRVISAGNARAVTNMLVEAVEQSQEGPVLEGYRFAGISSLTGTPGADNLPRGTLTSVYIGYGPLPTKPYIILVWIDQPEPVYFGKDVAQPVFRQMAAYLVHYLGIAPYAEKDGADQ